MTRMKRLNVLLGVGIGAGLLCASLLTPGRSAAAPVTFNFGGTVSDIHTSLFTLGGVGANGFGAGLNMSGSYTFTPPGLDKNPSGNIGRFENVIQNLTVNVGNYTATFTPGTSLIRITSSPGGSSYELTVTGLSGNQVNGQSPTAFHLELSRPTGAFASDQLPTTPPSLSSFASVQWRLVFDSAGKRVAGTLNSLVPLPAAVWLFGAGLIALIGLGSRGLTRKDSQA